MVHFNVLSVEMREQRVNKDPNTQTLILTDSKRRLTKTMLRRLNLHTSVEERAPGRVNRINSETVCLFIGVIQLVLSQHACDQIS